MVECSPSAYTTDTPLSRLKRILEGKYLKAAACLVQDREGLLAFYDLPAESWGPMRTTTPILSTYATLRARTDKTHLCLSRITRQGIVFKLCQSAAKWWQQLQAAHDLSGWAAGSTRHRVSPLYATPDNRWKMSYGSHGDSHSYAPVYKKSAKATALKRGFCPSQLKIIDNKDM